MPGYSEGLPAHPCYSALHKWEMLSFFMVLSLCFSLPLCLLMEGHGGILQRFQRFKVSFLFVLRLLALPWDLA